MDIIGYYYREKVHVNQFNEKIIQEGRREKNYPEVSPKSLTATNEYLDGWGLKNVMGCSP